jgi:hypothetical protein
MADASAQDVEARSIRDGAAVTRRGLDVMVHTPDGLTMRGWYRCFPDTVDPRPR